MRVSHKLLEVDPKYYGVLYFIQYSLSKATFGSYFYNCSSLGPNSSGSCLWFGCPYVGPFLTASLCAFSTVWSIVLDEYWIEEKCNFVYIIVWTMDEASIECRVTLNLLWLWHVFIFRYILWCSEFNALKVLNRCHTHKIWGFLI